MVLLLIAPVYTCTLNMHNYTHLKVIDLFFILYYMLTSYNQGDLDDNMMRICLYASLVK